MKKKSSYRFSEKVKSLLEALAEHYSITQTAVLEMLVRDKAREEGVKKE